MIYTSDDWKSIIETLKNDKTISNAMILNNI